MVHGFQLGRVTDLHGQTAVLVERVKATSPDGNTIRTCESYIVHHYCWMNTGLTGGSRGCDMWQGPLELHGVCSRYRFSLSALCLQR